MNVETNRIATQGAEPSEEPEGSGEVILYKSEDGRTRLKVQLDGETVWLTQAQIAWLFGVNSQAIPKHLKNIYEEGELDEPSACSKMEQVRLEGNRTVRRIAKVYNLDAVISVGYRVNSKRATHFRCWVTGVLRDYIVKGFALDDERLKRGDSDYWRELLDRIRDIRSSEKMLMPPCHCAAAKMRRRIEQVRWFSRGKSARLPRILPPGAALVRSNVAFCKRGPSAASRGRKPRKCRAVREARSTQLYSHRFVQEQLI